MCLRTCLYHAPKHVVMAVVLLAGMNLGGCRKVDRIEHEMSRGDQLGTIGLALSQYIERHDRLPPLLEYDEDGRVIGNWRTLLASEFEREPGSWIVDNGAPTYFRTRPADVYDATTVMMAAYGDGREFRDPRTDSGKELWVVAVQPSDAVEWTGGSQFTLTDVIEQVGRSEDAAGYDLGCLFSDGSVTRVSISRSSD